MKLRIKKSGSVYYLQKKVWLGWETISDVVDYHGEAAVDTPVTFKELEEVHDFIRTKYANENIEIVEA